MCHMTLSHDFLTTDYGSTILSQVCGSNLQSLCTDVRCCCSIVTSWLPLPHVLHRVRTLGSHTLWLSASH